MAKYSSFEELPIWKDARVLVDNIYEISYRSSFKRDFQFIDHLRRTAISIPSNIAEGFERDGNKEFLNFLSIAKGSCGELRTQLYIAFDRNYIDQDQLDNLLERALSISRSLSNLIKYLKNSNLKEGNTAKSILESWNFGILEYLFSNLKSPSNLQPR